MKKSLLPCLFFITIAFFQRNEKSSENNTRPFWTEEWLNRNTEEKLEEVVHQLGGFSRTMVEVGHRYSELYWAG